LQRFLNLLVIGRPGCHDAVNLQLKQLNTTPLSNLSPPRLRVSGLCPRLPQHGALKLVQPLGLDLARDGSSVRNLSTTRVIHTVYYLYKTLSTVPVVGKCLIRKKLYFPVTLRYVWLALDNAIDSISVQTCGVPPSLRLPCILTVPV
jgi:hypothetical protein